MPYTVSNTAEVWRRRFLAEHELVVEIAAQMGAAQATESAERSALQIQEGAMGPLYLNATQQVFASLAGKQVLRVCDRSPI